MEQLKLRARISEKTCIEFRLEDLVKPNPLFSIRELVKPWLLKGGKPDLYAFDDEHNKPVYEGDICRWGSEDGEFYIGVLWLKWEKETLGFAWEDVRCITEEAIGEDCELRDKNWTGSLERLGNITANPELLKEVG